MIRAKWSRIVRRRDRWTVALPQRGHGGMAVPGELLSRSICPFSIGHQMSRQMLEESVEDLLAAPKRSPL
jgi:hypothetical protein